MALAARKIIKIDEEKCDGCGLCIPGCAAFAYGSIHSDFMKDRAVVIGCPKFDDIRAYLDKLTAIAAANGIQSITVAIMEVPCCSGLAQAARLAVANTGKTVPVEVKGVGLSGDLKDP